MQSRVLSTLFHMHLALKEAAMKMENLKATLEEERFNHSQSRILLF